MKRFYSFLIALLALPMGMWAQGWPANYSGVMLQGFYWDSYTDSQWSRLESQVNDFKGYFDLIWVPQSGKCLENYNVMGYTPYYYWNQNSSFGTEAQLRSMIKTFKNNGIGIIADVVINHHNTNGWFNFPAETYKGVTYQFKSTDICANDDGGAAKTEADREGVSLSSNNDEGEDWGGMRDLDHKSSNVQTIVKAYEDYLLNDLGYAGFRYDMVKGFSGSHVADYNQTANVTYSVGEYWDGNASTVKNWINATKINNVIYSAAFDFPFRYTVRDAVNGTWSSLANASLASDANYRRYAVTFVENHDTQYRSATEQNDPIRRDTLAANAFLLAMPGTPCVFFAHWLDYMQDIKSMIDVRKFVGINNQSTYSQYRSNKSYFANTVNGSNNKKLLVAVGSGLKSFSEPSTQQWIKVLSGYHYAYYLNPSCETPWADKASGTYSSSFSTKLTAVSATSGAQLVYTLDGSTPTASHGTKVASGTSVSITSSCTLTVGLLVNGSVTSTISRNYTVAAFQPYTFTIYINTDQVGWNDYVNVHCWGGTTSSNGTTWPGKRVTATTTIGGKKWFYSTYTMSTARDAVNFVFDIGTSSTASQNQTIDVNSYSKDAFFEISSDKQDGKYKVNDVTSTYTAGINTITVDKKANADEGWYTISGTRTAEKPAQKGIYIHEGKKVVVK